jgi:hypothetical protein
MKHLLRTALCGLLLAAGAIIAHAKPAPVTLTEDAETYTFDNGIVTARRCATRASRCSRPS